MDPRQERTNRNIINAFLKLRSQKPIEKITIRELSEIAQIHKATFYLHYHDIYELSEMLEQKVIQDILNGLTEPAMILTDISRFNEELYSLMLANESLMEILFSGSRAGMLVIQLEQKLKQYIFHRRPEWNTFKINVILTYLIHGGYHVYIQYKNTAHSKPEDLKEIMWIINQTASAILNMYTQENNG
ncbi:MAG: TetR/AcrR family transcriptional regulator [Oscillospiraceae bacterium]|nr:TetR/AcrR family transcriptional regulator [Oscillospiraceae bacterium]MDE5884716.1 TetR/AcrR family transcriptional regulator [Oscillospiraceae bacterium]